MLEYTCEVGDRGKKSDGGVVLWIREHYVRCGIYKTQIYDIKVKYLIWIIAFYTPQNL